MGCAIYLTIKAFTQIDFKNAATIGDKIVVLLTGTNGVLLAALMSTFGVYLITSLLYADPWHMFHSFPQYIGIAPSFINILMVYSFANLHDVVGTNFSELMEILPLIKTCDG